MNSELINRLAVEAGDYANRVYTPPVRSKTLGILWEPGHFAWHAIFQEKFAELIVRECLAECWYDATPKQIADRIREKLGVEE
jgi:hypothetical protein